MLGRTKWTWRGLSWMGEHKKIIFTTEYLINRPYTYQSQTGINSHCVIHTLAKTYMVKCSTDLVNEGNNRSSLSSLQCCSPPSANRGIHRSQVNSPHKGQWRGALMFSLICVWINGWVNNREAGDLRRHCAHYDVIVMRKPLNHRNWWKMYIEHLPSKLFFAHYVFVTLWHKNITNLVYVWSLI